MLPYVRTNIRSFGVPGFKSSAPYSIIDYAVLSINSEASISAILIESSPAACGSNSLVNNVASIGSVKKKEAAPAVDVDNKD